MNSIDPNAVSDGHPVIIQDEMKNVARGEVSFDEKGLMILRAFRTDIVIARWSAQARGGLGGYTPAKGIRIVGHEPPMEFNVVDLVPRQKFGGVNPT